MSEQGALSGEVFSEATTQLQLEGGLAHLVPTQSAPIRLRAYRRARHMSREALPTELAKGMIVHEEKAPGDKSG